MERTLRLRIQPGTDGERDAARNRCIEVSSKTLGKGPTPAACLTAATKGLRSYRSAISSEKSRTSSGSSMRRGGAAALGEHRREALGPHELAGRLQLPRQPLEPLLEGLEF